MGDDSDDGADVGEEEEEEQEEAEWDQGHGLDTEEAEHTMQEAVDDTRMITAAGTRSTHAAKEGEQATRRACKRAACALRRLAR